MEEAPPAMPPAPMLPEITGMPPMAEPSIAGPPAAPPGMGLEDILDVVPETAASVPPGLPPMLDDVEDKGGALLDRDEIRELIASADRQLAGSGRLLVRRSGTEAKIRIMAEGEDESLLQTVIDDVAGAIEQHAG